MSYKKNKTLVIETTCLVILLPVKNVNTLDVFTSLLQERRYTQVWSIGLVSAKD